MERQLTSLTITADDEVKVRYTGMVVTAGEETNEEGAQDNVKYRKYAVESDDPVHKELADQIKKLKKYALEICEIDPQGDELRNWAVSGINISGDVVLKKSRAVITLAKLVKRTKKIIHLKSPQVTMYPDGDDKSAGLAYANADKLAEIIEAIIDEVWDYLDGVHNEEGQLALVFPEPVLEKA